MIASRLAARCFALHVGASGLEYEQLLYAQEAEAGVREIRALDICHVNSKIVHSACIHAHSLAPNLACILATPTIPWSRD